MSFCPTDDLHSIYLDNEMPEAHKAEYESHIKVCPECQRKLENIRKLHDLFESDSKSIEMDDARLEKSYEKLMSRMAYTKNVHNAERKTHSSWKYICSAAAAAMVFALIIPLRLNSKGSAVEAGSTTVANINASSMQPVTNVSVGGGNGVIVSGNILICGDCEKSIIVFGCCSFGIPHILTRSLGVRSVCIPFVTSLSTLIFCFSI